MGADMVRCVALAGAVSALALSGQVAVAEPNGWTGFNVSVGGGISKNNGGLDVTTSTNDRLDILPIPPPSPISAFVSILGDATGNARVGGNEWQGMGTLQGGYDQQLGSFVVGGFANFDFYPGDNENEVTQGIDGSLTLALFPPLGPSVSFPIPGYAAATSSIELKNTWSIGGRIGYLFTPSTLIYGLGGYTQASLDGQVDFSYLTFAGPQSLSLNASDELHGYFVGAGGEVKVTDNIGLRLEYRYANYQGATRSEPVNFDTGPGLITYTQSASIEADLDAEIHTVRGALVLQLGDP